jgi:murein lipoprotein
MDLRVIFRRPFLDTLIRKEVPIMKQMLLVVSIMLAFVIAAGGCATKGELEEVQAREKAIAAKADQAAQDAEAAKMAADEAISKANEAILRAEEAEKRAIERERIADEKAKEAELMFQQSMKK